MDVDVDGGWRELKTDRLTSRPFTHAALQPDAKAPHGVRRNPDRDHGGYPWTTRGAEPCGDTQVLADLDFLSKLGHESYVPVRPKPSYAPAPLQLRSRGKVKKVGMF